VSEKIERTSAARVGALSARAKRLFARCSGLTGMIANVKAEGLKLKALDMVVKSDE
jgi:hypothetical protein